MDSKIIGLCKRLRLISLETSTALELQNQNVTFEEVAALCEAVEQDSKLDLSNLDTIRLGFNSIRNAGIERLMYSLGSEGCFLTTLDVGFNGIGDEGVKAIVGYISKAQSLKILYLSGNAITYDGFACLGGALGGEVCSLEELHLSANFGGTCGARALALNLPNNNSLRILTVASAGFGENGCRLFFSALAGNTSLRTLNISSNRSGDSGAFSLSMALSTGMCALTEIDLSFNSLSSCGLETLVCTLPGYGGLTSLELNKNEIGDSGARTLASYLAKHSKLKKLGLGFNSIHSEGIIAITRALTPNVTLETLTLSGNPMKLDAIRYLGEMLCHDRSLLYLGLDNVLFHTSDSGERVLASAIASNRVLRLKTLTGFNLSAALIQLGSPEEMAGLSNESALRRLQDMWTAHNENIPSSCPEDRIHERESSRAGNDLKFQAGHHSEDSDGATDKSENSDDAPLNSDYMAARLSRLSVNESEEGGSPSSGAKTARERGRLLSEEVTDAVKSASNGAKSRGSSPPPIMPPPLPPPLSLPSSQIPSSSSSLSSPIISPAMAALMVEAEAEGALDYEREGGKGGEKREKRPRSLSCQSPNKNEGMDTIARFPVPGNGTSSVGEADVPSTHTFFTGMGVHSLPPLSSAFPPSSGTTIATRESTRIENVLGLPMALVQATGNIGNQPFVASELWELEQFYFSPDPEVHHPDRVCAPLDSKLGGKDGGDSCVDGSAAHKQHLDVSTGQSSIRPPAKRHKNDKSAPVLRISKYPRLKLFVEDIKKRDDEVRLLAVLRQLRFVEGWYYNQDWQGVPLMRDPSQMETLILDVL